MTTLLQLGVYGIKSEFKIYFSNLTESLLFRSSNVADATSRDTLQLIRERLSGKKHKSARDKTEM